MIPPLILASASPRRSQLLREAGLEFTIITHPVEELHDESVGARELCLANARLKATPVAERHPRELVIGADTLVTLNNKPYGKPKDLEHARQMLGELQGQTHEVVTAVALMHLESAREDIFHSTTKVTFKSLTSDQINHYITLAHTLDKAGAYGIQEHGELIVERIDGSYSNVVGLPVEELVRRLKDWAGQER